MKEKLKMRSAKILDMLRWERSSHEIRDFWAD